MTALSLKLAAQCLEFDIKSDIASFLWGPPGIGKSQVVHQIAKRLDLELIDLRLSLRDPVDLRGLPYIDQKTGVTKWLPPSELPTKGKGILFLDEMNTVGPAMQAPAMGLVLDRKLGEYRLPKGWVPVAAGNRLADKAAAQRIGTALKNRFTHYEVTVDLEAFCDHANGFGFHPMVVAFLRMRPELLHKMPAGDENAFPTPRAWEVVCKYADAPEAIRQTLVAGRVGDGPAAEFEGFARVWARLPSLDQIFKDPMAARVPPMDEPAVYYAVSTAIARRCTKANFDNAMIYAQRLTQVTGGKEFEIMIVTDATRRDKSLIETRGYTQWAVRNQDVLI